MAGTYKSKRNPTGYPDFTLPIGLLMQLIPVKLVPDWGAIQAEDVDLQGSASTSGGILTTLIDYTVPPGKNLLVYDVSCFVAGSDTGIYLIMRNFTDNIDLYYLGGMVGRDVTFSKPKRLVANKRLVVEATHNESGITRTVYASVGGVLL